MDICECGVAFATDNKIHNFQYFNSRLGKTVFIECVMK